MPNPKAGEKTKKPVVPEKIIEGTCHVCGQALVQPSGRGRKREYHPDCGRLVRDMRSLQNSIEKCRPYMKGKYRNRLRQELWILANLMNGKQKTETREELRGEVSSGRVPMRHGIQMGHG